MGHEKPSNNTPMTPSQSQSHSLVCFVFGRHRGTLFFFKEGGVTVNVTSIRYCEILDNFLHPKIGEYDNIKAF